MPSENARIVARLYEAINRRDFDAGFELVAADFEWRVPDRAIFAGTHRGREEVERVIDAQLEVFEEFEIVPEEFFEKDDQVVVFVRQRARGGASGVEVEIRIGHLWTFRDGTPASLEVFPEREKALEAARLA
jgi:ketosteroid isomerase-like protein